MARTRSWPGASGKARPAMLALATEVALLVVALWLAGHVIVLTTHGAQIPNGDVKEYRSYALTFWTVAPLFRHLPVEYPPLAIFPFTLTLLPPLPDAVDVFAVWMSAFVVMAYLWMRRTFSREQAIAFVVLLLVGANSTVLARFDLFPALATLGALWALRDRRFTLAYGLLAVGILLKLYPLFLVPIVAIEQWRVLRAIAPQHAHAARRAAGIADRLRQAWRAARAEAATEAARQTALGLLLCAALVGAAFAAAALLSPSGAFSGFTYESSRPLQIESVPASVLWLSTLVGSHAHAVYTFESLNLVGPLDAVLGPLAEVALVAGCLYVYWLQSRGRLDVARAMLACLCVVLVANKVFSPQYLIWVFPLIALAEGVDWCWLAIGALTTVIYPFLYFDHLRITDVAADWRFLPVVALRNALLVLATVRAIRGAEVALVPGGARHHSRSAERTPQRRGDGPRSVVGHR